VYEIIETYFGGVSIFMHVCYVSDLMYYTHFCRLNKIYKMTVDHFDYFNYVIDYLRSNISVLKILDLVLFDMLNSA